MTFKDIMDIFWWVLIYLAGIGVGAFTYRKTLAKNHYADGYAKGCEDGYESGREVGHHVGYEAGYKDGINICQQTPKE